MSLYSDGNDGFGTLVRPFMSVDVLRNPLYIARTMRKGSRYIVTSEGVYEVGPVEKVSFRPRRVVVDYFIEDAERSGRLFDDGERYCSISPLENLLGAESVEYFGPCRTIARAHNPKSFINRVEFGLGRGGRRYVGKAFEVTLAFSDAPLVPRDWTGSAVPRNDIITIWVGFPKPNMPNGEISMNTSTVDRSLAPLAYRLEQEALRCLERYRTDVHGLWYAEHPLGTSVRGEDHTRHTEDRMALAAAVE